MRKICREMSADECPVVNTSAYLQIVVTPVFHMLCDTSVFCICLSMPGAIFLLADLP